MIEQFAQNLAQKRAVYDTVETIKEGWTNYNFIFYISSVSVILGGLFGATGFLGFLVTIVFFYYAGRFNRGWKSVWQKHAKR